MIKVDGLAIAETYTEYGVMIDDVLIDCDDEDEARQFAATIGSSILERQHFMSDWTEGSINTNNNSGE